MVKRTMKWGVCLLLATMLFSGCKTNSYFSISTPAQINQVITKIHQGMAQDQVLQLLGKPDNKRIIDGREIWQYTKSVVLSYDKVIEVGFENGVVQYLNTFDDTTRH